MLDNGVEIRFGRADVVLDILESESVDDLPYLEPLEEPARFVRVVVAGQILIEEQQNAAGEAMIGDQYQCGRGIVRVLLKVDHLVVVELDEPAGRRS